MRSEQDCSMFQGECFLSRGGRKEEKINGLNQNIQLWNFQSFRVESEKSTRRKNPFIHFQSECQNKRTKRKTRVEKQSKE